MNQNNIITIKLSDATCRKLAGLLDAVPSDEAQILKYKYDETDEASINQEYGVFGSVTGRYTKKDGMSISINIGDNLISMCIGLVHSFVPTLFSAVGSAYAFALQFKQMLTGNKVTAAVPRIKSGDKVKLIYKIGRSKTAASKEIVVGKSEMGDKIDYVLEGSRVGSTHKVNINVMGVDMPITINVSKLIEAANTETEMSGVDCDISSAKVYGGTVAGTASEDHLANSDDVHNGSSAVLFSCDEQSDEPIVEAVRDMRNEARANGMSAEEYFGNALEMDGVKSWDEL
jgi:hypothetical protein